MAELQHDRTLGQTVTQTFAFDGGDLLAAAAVVSIRLWLDRPDQPPGDIFKEAFNPAVCVAIDTLVASGGKVIRGRGNALIVTFSDVFTGILAARRLQWAFEGLSEAARFSSAAAAVVVHSSQDLPPNPTDADIASPLENALPGQILLSDGACRVLDNLHVMSCESTNHPPFRALSWRRSEAESGSAADEQTLFRNIKEQGNSDVRSSANRATDTLGILAGTGEAALPGNRQPGRFPFQDIFADFTGLVRRSPRVVWAGSGFAALCAAGFIAIALHRAPAPPQPARSDTSSTPLEKSPLAPALPAVPAASTVKTKSPTVKVVGAAPAKSPPKKEPLEVTKASESSGQCDIKLERILKRAEDHRNAGRFGDAAQDYNSVLKCDPKNAQATNGLAHLKEERRLQGR
jgi:hypothetical protein